jgi:ABC-type transport system substrate-binding protein
MEEAFGYRYNDSAEDDEDRLGYFSMVIMAPTSRDDRMEWAALTTKVFQEIGIDVTLKYANWNIAVPRVFDRPTEGTQGFDYAHGGYDGFFIGWTGAPTSNVAQWFYEYNFIPYGTNLGYIDNDEVEGILDECLKDRDPAVRDAAFKEFQQWFKDELPYFIVLQLDDLWAKDPDLNGVSFSFDYPNYQNWTHTTDDVVTVMTPGDFIDLNPHQIGSYYDWLATGASSMHETLIATVAGEGGKYYGQLAESWSYSEDQLVWEFKLRDGLEFSDGSACTIDDVIFSYDKFLDPEVNAYGGTSMATYLNRSSIEKINDTSVRFTMNEFYVYAEGLMGAGAAILSEAELGDLTGPQWKTDAATNTEYAPLGTGRYMMDKPNTNIAEGKSSLVLNPYYDNVTRGHPDWQNADPIPTIKVELYTSAASAVAALSSGALNIIDSNVALQPFRSEINASTWGEITQVPGWGHQGFYVNQFNPIWGMNPGDPREMYPEDYAQTPFDLTAVFFGLLMLVSIQVIRRRK